MTPPPDDSSGQPDTALAATPDLRGGRGGAETITSSEVDAPGDLAQASTGVADSLGGAREQPLPATIGRYRVQRHLGAGGMGVVYAAHDPELDRTVAVKVVRERHDDDLALQHRLRREAQALARLSHPHVVSVFDVGVDRGRIYIVMQFVDGPSLDGWLDTERPPPARVTELFLQAGRGVAAAHAAGLIHRDFKPGNVLLEADGSARVTDFGLARLSDLAEQTDSPSADNAPLTWSMTRGDVVGTPAYMAPEQHLGGSVTAAADQFAFAVSLWEALVGRRPFAGRDLASLRKSVLAGTVDEPPAGAMPRRVERALRRAIALQPADRFADMDALLEALTPPRRRWIAFVGTGLIGASVAAAVMLTGGERAGADPCAGADAAIDRVWTPARRDAVHAAIAAADPRDGEYLASVATTRLDDRATRWRAMRHDACEAAHQPERNPELDQRRARCLDASLASLDQAVGALAEAKVVQLAMRSLGIASAGIDPAQCSAGAMIKLRSTAKLASDELVARVAALDVAREAGRYEEVLRIGPPLAAEIEATGDLGLAARTWWAVGQIAGVLPTDVVREASRHAAQAATAIGDDYLAVLAWTQVIESAAGAGRLEQLDDLLAAARGAAARDGSANTRILVDVTAANVAAARGEYEVAIAACQLALGEANQIAEVGPTLAALACLDDALVRLGRLPEVEQIAIAAEQQLRHHYGDRHPLTSLARKQQALARFNMGQRDRGRAELVAVIAELEVSVGAESIVVMNVLSDVALAESEDGNFATPEAIAASNRALAIGKKSLPADDRQLARLLWIHADITAGAGDFELAATEYTTALAVFDRLDDRTAWAKLALNAANLDLSLGRCDRALPRFERIAELSRDGTVSPVVGASARGALGSCQVQLGQLAEGMATLAPAVDELRALGELELAGQYWLWIAEAEWVSGRHEQARDIARKVKALLPGDNKTHQEFRQQADDWYLAPKPGIRG